MNVLSIGSHPSAKFVGSSKEIGPDNQSLEEIQFPLNELPNDLFHHCLVDCFLINRSSYEVCQGWRKCINISIVPNLLNSGALELYEVPFFKKCSLFRSSKLTCFFEYLYGMRSLESLQILARRKITPIKADPDTIMQNDEDTVSDSEGISDRHEEDTESDSEGIPDRNEGTTFIFHPIVKLYLSELNELKWSNTQLVEKIFQNVISLTISVFSIIPPGSSFPEVRELNIYDYEAKYIQFASFPRLEKLRLTIDPLKRTNDVFRIDAGMHHLRWLRIDSNTVHYCSELMKDSQLPDALETAYLIYVTIPPQFFPSSSKLKLLHLEIVRGFDLKVISNLKMLEEISLIDSIEGSSVSINLPDSLTNCYIEQPKTLKELKIDAKNLKKLTLNCPDLKKLQIPRGCELIHKGHTFTSQ